MKVICEYHRRCAVVSCDHKVPHEPMTTVVGTCEKEDACTIQSTNDSTFLVRCRQYIGGPRPNRKGIKVRS